MGLDFFKLDDEQFESKFQNSLNDTKVYVVGKSREETTYRILNELKNKNSKRITLVVKSEKEWNKLQHSNLSGNILVPFFYADRIVVIPNNTNIFIYGEDEPCYTQNKLILRKRTKRKKQPKTPKKLPHRRRRHPRPEVKQTKPAERRSRKRQTHPRRHLPGEKMGQPYKRPDRP